MPVEVDFVTLGDASERLGVAQGTLRNWTDSLEDFEVHYVKRNIRNERIYYDTDLQIFEFLRDLKSEHGRKTTTKDLALLILEMGDRFQLRRGEDAPQPNPSNKTADLLSQDDIQRLMQSERVRQFMGIIVAETTKNIRDDLSVELRDTLKKEIRHELAETNSKLEEVAERIENAHKERDSQVTAMIAEMREHRKQIEESKKPRWKRWLQKLIKE